jgi:DnaB-like helicase N terminal domain/AAA domain
MTFNADAVAQTERALLGSVLLENSLWPQTAELSVSDFSLDSHRRIFCRMAALFEDQRPVDPVTVTMELGQLNQLDSCGGAAYLGSLLEHAFPENFDAYVRSVREAAAERQFARLQERLSSANSHEERLDLARQMQEMLSGSKQAHNWRGLFHSYEQIVNAPPARFAIEGFLQEEGITLIGGLAGNGKTLFALAMAKALLEGGKLFHHFTVNKRAERVVYLIPEAGLGPFAARLKTFRLQEHIREGRLFCRTLSAPGQLALSDPRLLEAVKGSDLFLDTAIRFMSGDENDANEQKIFAETLFSLQRAGCRTITGAHHSPKSFCRDSYMALENVLRGSGDIGAMLTTCWGLSQIDSPSNRIFVQNVKARDFSPCEPFIIQGRPSIDQTGFFELTHPPGFAGNLSDNKSKGGRPEVPDKDEKIAQARRLKDQGLSHRDIARQLGISAATVSTWLSPKQ